MTEDDSLRQELVAALRSRMRDPECPPAVYSAVVAYLKGLGDRKDVGASELSEMLQRYAPARTFKAGARAS